MPPRQVKTAHKSNSQAIVSAKGGASESLNSFLGGFAPAGVVASDPASPASPTAQQEEEGAIAMNLKLLNKSSETTKLKSLVELTARVGAARENSLPQFVANIAEAVIMHAHHLNPQVRSSVFVVLKVLMERGKDVKVSLVPSLPALMPEWVMGMHDMEANVRQAAKAAFDCAFSVEKRPVVLLKYKDDILRVLFDNVTSIVMGGKPLKDDTQDVAANTLFSSLRALGYLVRQVSSSQASVLAFLLEKPAFLKALPAHTPEKNYIAERTPLVRSAALSLLRDMTSVCPCTPRMNQLIAQAVHGSIKDANAIVASRVWELLLFWCRGSVPDVVSSLSKGFLDDVVDSFMDCKRPELAEVIFPCLFPLLTRLSTDSRLTDMLDEFCGALVEKLHLLSETPNVSAQEMQVVFQALMECWELHCVRKKGTDAAKDSDELFTVVLLNLSTLLQLPAKKRRYEGAVVKTLSHSLLKTSTRNEGAFRHCVAVLRDLPDAPFKALPEDASESLTHSFQHLAAATLGALRATAAQEGTYSRQMPMYDSILADALTSYIAQDDSSSLCELLTHVGPGYRPEQTERGALADYLLAAIPKLEQHGSDEEKQQESAANCKAVLATVLSWGDAGTVDRLAEVARSSAMEEVRDVVKEQMLKDPAKTFDLLVASCETNYFEDIHRCVEQLVDSGESLSTVQQEGLLAAVCAGLNDTLKLVKGHDDQMEQERESMDGGQSETERGFTGDDEGDAGRRAPAGVADIIDSTMAPSAPTRPQREQKRKKNTNGTDAETNEDEDDSESTSQPGDDGEGTLENNGQEAARRVSTWVGLLECGQPLATFLQLNVDVLEERLAPLFYRITGAVAPPVYPEQYASVRALRVALEHRMQDDSVSVSSGDSASVSSHSDFDLAMEEKVHFLKTEEFNELVTAVCGLLDSYSLPAAARDAYAERLVRWVRDGILPSCYEAAQQLHQIIPFASKGLMRELVASTCEDGRYALNRIMPDDESDTADWLGLFDGYYALADIDVSLFLVVRSGQFLRVIDTCELLRPGEDTEVQRQQSLHILLYLLRTAAAREVFADGIRAALFQRLLPAAMELVDSKNVASELADLISHDEQAGAALFVTLAAVLRDVAATVTDCSSPNSSECTDFLLRGRRLMSAVTTIVVSNLFTPGGAKKIPRELAATYMNFYAAMDMVANTVRDNMLAQIPKDQESLVLEACCMLPTWDVTVAKLALVVQRHLSTLPVVAPDTVKSLVAYAQKQHPLDCLELLAELSMARILDLSAYSEVVRVIVHSLCRCYTLRHLPTNGRLSQQPEGRAAAPLPFGQLRRIAMAAIVSRRGVVIHSRVDDVLRSTVNLVVFDIVCEAVSRLRSTKGDEVPLLAKLIALTSDFMSELLTSDVAVLRGSAASVSTIASVLCFAYLWVNATPIAKLEAIGVDTVSAVMRSVCQLANLSLMRSGTPLQQQMQMVTEKISLKALRSEFSSADPLKIAKVRRQNLLVAKTQKQRLLLFPYLLAWAVYLTSSTAVAGDVASTALSDNRRSFKERRAETYTVLDLLLVLLFTPLLKKSKGVRLEETVIGSAIGADDSAPLAGVLGFEVVALTRTDASDPMVQLARGAASVLTLLVHGPTLPYVKGWIETLERKLQALIYDFVEVYVSPTLIQENLLSVQSHSPDGSNAFNASDELSVRVSTAQRAIDLTYEMEDAKVNVTIAFPAAFPLRKPTVEYGNSRDCGISTEKWRSWMLKMAAMLFSGATDTWQCVELFQRNMDAHLGGQEPCPICFAVVNAINHKLPDMQCSVCHNTAFHSSCLYTWWANGGQNVCPLCRSPWISE